MTSALAANGKMFICSPAATDENLCITRAASTPRVRTSRPMRRSRRNFLSGMTHRLPRRAPDQGPINTLKRLTFPKADRNFGCNPKMPSMISTACFGSCRMLPVFSWMVPVLKQNFGSSTALPSRSASKSSLIFSILRDPGSSKFSSPLASCGCVGSARALISHSKGRASKPLA